MSKRPAGKRVCVVGTGYVGLVTGACLARLGHAVCCVDSDAAKIRTLRAGKIPIYEPGLEPLVQEGVRRGRLSFSDSIPAGLRLPGGQAEFVFIAVGTPPRPDGSADLSAVEAVARAVAENLKRYAVLVDKSTVPVETGDWVLKTVARARRGGVPFDVASNPEFLREGSAVTDFLKPDRIVLGVSSPRAEALLRELYAPLAAPVLVTDVKSAELIKHASNSFLAMKISYANALSAVCEKVGADVSLVTRGLGMDRRIGPAFLNAGIGYGGFCLHPDERVILRDPQGLIQTLPIGQAYKAVAMGPGRWEALSMDPASDRVAFMPVSGVSRREYDGLLIGIKTKMGKSVRVTSDHPLLVRGGAGWALRTAAELTPADRLPCFLTASEEMASGVTMLAHSLGVVPSHKTAMDPKATRPAHFLRISGAAQVRALPGMKGSAHAARILARLAALKRAPRPAGFLPVSSAVAALRIVSLARRGYRGPVYSIEVAGNETFALANGLVVHNCFPKDLEAFYWICQKKGYDFKLLKDVMQVNEEQKGWMLRKVSEELWNLEGKRAAVLGLSFKPHTDDLRYAPALEIIAGLQQAGMAVRTYDPVTMPKARRLLKGVEFCKDAYACARGADALLLVTEWPEFARLDLKKVKAAMRVPLLLDGRNLFDPAAVRKLGFTYKSVGRP